MKTTMRTVALVFFLAISSCAQVKQAAPLTSAELSKPIPAKGITVRYIANEGVLIAAGGRQVLIDGLHREYKPAYLFPPPEMQSLLENARAPYDKINILLVSHMHLDHFHPQSIGLYLNGNPKSVFASSGQVVDEVAKNFAGYEKVKSQIRPVIHEWKKSSMIDQDGIKIKFLGLRHSGEQFKHIQNLGHVIEIGGKKFLHIGDADMTAENFAAFNLSAEKIDVAFIPYWFLLSADGRKFVKDQFAAKQVIAVHIPPAEAEEVIQQLKRDLPEATTFTKILEERSV
jgi:L-ascorbate metabolism protein UlaG (beta-lactamase superfamily)